MAGYVSLQKPGRVLILDAELHPETIAHRLPAVAEAMGIPPEQYQGCIDVLPLRGLGYDLVTIAPFIESIEPGRYALSIFDAWYRFLPIGYSENDNAQVMGLYNRIDGYTDRLRAGWLNIHHASKGDQAAKSVTDVGSGTGSQSRAADTHLIIRPHEEEGISVIEAAVRSFPQVPPLAVRWNFPVWVPDGAADPRKLKGLKTKKEQTAQAKSERLEEDRKTIVNAMVRMGNPETMMAIRDLAGLVTRISVSRGRHFWRIRPFPFVGKSKTTARNTTLSVLRRQRKGKSEHRDSIGIPSG